MKEGLRPREQKAYVRRKMPEVSADNNTSIVLSSDTELEEGEEESARDRKRKNSDSEPLSKEEEDKLFGTPSVLSRSQSSGSVSRTEPGTGTVPPVPPKKMFYPPATIC
jgi:hypothetical protein